MCITLRLTIMKNTGLLGDGHCSIQIISCDHADKDASLLARSDSLNDVRTKWVRYTDESIQTHFLLQLIRAFSNCGLGNVHDGIDIIPVAKSDAAKGRSGVLLDGGLDFGSLGRC